MNNALSYRKFRIVKTGILGFLVWLILSLSACGIHTVAPVVSEPPQAVVSRPALQSPPSSASLEEPVYFERISVTEGLSKSTVRSILQDRSGFIWFGTEDGLNRFDGYEFLVFKHDPDDSNSLSSNDINVIYESRDGNIWIGTRGGGLNSLDRRTGQITRYQHVDGDPNRIGSDIVQSIIEDRDGMLWIGTIGGGLDRLDPRTEVFTHYTYKLDEPAGIASNDILSLCQDAAGVLWVGTNNGLDRFDQQTQAFIHHRHDPSNPDSLSNNNVYTLHITRGGVLWVGTADGMNSYDPAANVFTRYLDNRNKTDENSVQNSISVRTLVETSSGHLWVGTLTGIYRFNPDTHMFFLYENDPQDSSTVSNNRILALYEDRAGSLWIGTEGGGVNQVNRSRHRFSHFSYKPSQVNSLSHNTVMAFAEDPTGDVWIATNGGGVNRLNVSLELYYYYNYDAQFTYSLSSNNAHTVFVDTSGNLWVGTQTGLDRRGRGIGWFRRFQNDPGNAASLSENNITTIAQDQAGNIWIGTESGGLNRYDSSTGEFIRFTHSPTDPQSIAPGAIQALFVDSSNTLWIGTDNGLDRYDRARKLFVHYRHDPYKPETLSSNQVLSIYESSLGTLWVGTKGGLNRFDRSSGSFTSFREKHGLPNDYIQCILEDKRSNLWLSTDRGISKYNPSSGMFKNYDEQDGLQSNEFLQGSCLKTRNGEMFFGGINGYNRFNPDAIEDNPFIPPVVITSLGQGGESLSPAGMVDHLPDLTLNWPKNYFEFEFAALNYVQPERNQYAYKLENYDRDWIRLENSRSGRYTNLPGGSYVLQIKGSNNDGVWNEAGTSLQIRVVPPVWEQPLFQVGAVMVLAVTLLMTFRLRIGAEQRRNRQLTTQVGERTREIEQRRQVAEGLREILIQLNSNRPLEESLTFIACQVYRLMEAGRVMIFQSSDGEQERIQTVYHEGETSVNAEISPYVLNWLSELIRGGEHQVIRALPVYLKERPQLDVPLFSGIQVLIIVPVLIEGSLFGGLTVMFLNKKAFKKEELDMLMSLADQVALAVGNARLRTKIQAYAVLSERNRLARELHDAVTQTLFSASMIAEALPAMWERDQVEARRLLNELHQLTRGAQAEMRSLLMELRPSAIVEARLVDLLRQLAEAVSGRTGANVTVSLCDNIILPGDVHVCFFRVAQEAVTNIVKHTHSSQVLLKLSCQPAVKGKTRPTGPMQVILEISDNGCGFDLDTVSSDHFGLMNIRERVQAIGANLEIISKPGYGTQVQAIWQGEVKKEHDR